jgi:hypothetical protein
MSTLTRRSFLKSLTASAALLAPAGMAEVKELKRLPEEQLINLTPVELVSCRNETDWPVYRFASKEGLVLAEITEAFLIPMLTNPIWIMKDTKTGAFYEFDISQSFESMLGEINLTYQEDSR